MQPKVFIIAAILAVSVALATSQECSYDNRVGYIIDIHNSEKNGAIFMSDIHSLTRENCQSACCSFEEETLDNGTVAVCNLAVFHNNSQRKNSKNCFLVFCPKEDSCRLTKVKGFSSSYVTRSTSLVTESNVVEDVKQIQQDYEESTQSSTLLPEDFSLPRGTSKATPSPMSTSPSKSTPLADSKSSSSRVPFESTLNPLAGNLHGNQTNIGNDTAASVDSSDDDQDSSNHTVIASNGALIVAVCFGILFLLAVLVVLGKRWYEGYQRRHYSKVDYLINGMYN